MITDIERVWRQDGEYLWCRAYWERAVKSFWTHLEISLVSDIKDWKHHTTEIDRFVISSILKTFTQSELVVEDYWSSKVSLWFKKPEIQQVCSMFAAFETIHVRSYSYLNESLGLEHELSEFLQVPEFKAKIDKLVDFEGLPWDSEENDGLDRIRDIALSLAVFSAFTEGVNLYSSFIILGSFRMRNLFKGMSNIIEYSILDESQHSEFGCELFRVLINQYPEIWTDDFKRHIYQAARDAVALEDAALDVVFSKGDLPNVSKQELKTFIRFRANDRLQKLGLKKNWKNLNIGDLKNLEWFDAFSSGIRQSDFFANRETSYQKISFDSGDLWEGYKEGAK
jgi:ribonucleoside-diphosphate reductase beta chain